MSEKLPFEIDVPQSLIDAVRTYSGDLPEYNRLIEGTETSDEKIKLAIQLWVQHFNMTPPIINKQYSATDFRNYMILIEGAIITMLKMSGIIQARNFLNFNDGGVSFTVNDKGQEYMSWINLLLSNHIQDVANMKTALNAEEAYDFIPSPEGWWYHRFDS